MIVNQVVNKKSDTKVSLPLPKEVVDHFIPYGFEEAWYWLSKDFEGYLDGIILLRDGELYDTFNLSLYDTESLDVYYKIKSKPDYLKDIKQTAPAFFDKKLQCLIDAAGIVI